MTFRELRVVVVHPDDRFLLVSGKHVQSVNEAERGANKRATRGPGGAARLPFLPPGHVWQKRRIRGSGLVGLT